MIDHELSGGKTFQIQDILHYLFLLFISKLFKSCGLYICYDLLKSIYVVPLLFFLISIKTIILFFLQKPFQTKKQVHNHNKQITTTIIHNKITRIQWLKIVKYSFFYLTIKLLWLFGLTLCGPLRTILIFEHSEFAIINALKAIFISQTSSPSRSRGVLLFLIGTFILLAFDHDDLREKVSFYSHTYLLSYNFFILSSLNNIQKDVIMELYLIYFILLFHGLMFLIIKAVFYFY
jgi:zinc transporter 5/7